MSFFYRLVLLLLTVFATPTLGCSTGTTTRPYTEVVTPPCLTRAASVTSPSPPTSVVATRGITQAATRAATITFVLQVTLPTFTAFQPPRLERLRQVMLELINRDRAAAGLAYVQTDSLAAQVGQAHAEEMAANLYMSHWNLRGLGPDLRYGMVGGRDAVMENVYMSWRRYSNGTPVPIDDWEHVVRKVQASLMTSLGHRANVLKPEHTHVGIGIAYNRQTGDIRVTQEFVNHYLELDPLPQTASLGDMLAVSGRLLSGATVPLINLDYEPLPRAMSAAELNATRTYTSPAQFVTAITPQTDTQGRFKATVPLVRGKQPGVYHVRVWVIASKERILATDAVVFVGVSVPSTWK